MADDCRIEPGIPHPDDRDRRTGFALRTPYDETFVDELKSLLPVQDRAWDDCRKTWWVDQAHGDFIIQLVVHHFGSLLVVGGDGESDRWVDQAGAHAQERLL